MLRGAEESPIPGSVAGIGYRAFAFFCSAARATGDYRRGSRKLCKERKKEVLNRRTLL